MRGRPFALAVAVMGACLPGRAAEPLPVRATLVAQSADAETPSRTRGAREFRPVLRFGVDDVMAEVAAWPDAEVAEQGLSLRASPYLTWQPARGWELRLGAMLGADRQSGGTLDLERSKVLPGETYLRYRTAGTRLTAGWQSVVWGRVDEVALIDRVSRTDARRFLLDDLPRRRLPVPALRWEQTMDDYKLDALALLGFEGAELPALGGVWSPIDRSAGRIIGVAPDPLTAPLIQAATVRRDDSGQGGAGLRLTREGDIGWGLTVARTRQSLPGFVADSTALTLDMVHPYIDFVGLDAAWGREGFTWRTEFALSRGQPLNAAADGRLLRANAVEWAGSVEFYPGDRETRVNLQFVARHLRVDEKALQLTEYAAVNGEVQTSFDRGRWKAALRFNLGLNVHDVYVSPRLSYLGFEPHELYLALHHFDGDSRTLGGFHDNHELIVLGLRTRF